MGNLWGSGQYIGKQGCYSDGPRWAEEIGGPKPHEVQQKQMYSPTSGLEQSCAPVWAGDNWLKSSFAEQDAGVLLDEKFNVCLQGALAAKGNSSNKAGEHSPLLST